MSKHDTSQDNAAAPFRSALKEHRSALDLTGQYVIVRTYSAGVHAGTLAARNGREVLLTNTRRIWYWRGAASLSELAGRGTSDPSGCKFPAPTDKVLLTEAIEILTCTPEARESIEGVPSWSS